MRQLRDILILRSSLYRFRRFRNHFSYRIGKGNSIQNKGIMISTKHHIDGNNNSLVINRGGCLLDCYVHIMGNNNTIEIGENAHLDTIQIWIEDNNCQIKIGDGTFIGDHTHLACTENKSIISIGSRCMLSSYIQIRTGDSHSLLDSEGNRINPAKSVYVSDHVWIGEGTKILKGAKIGKDCVVSTGAIVTKEFAEGLLIGGIPAKVLKENISWNSKRL